MITRYGFREFSSAREDAPLKRHKYGPLGIGSGGGGGDSSSAAETPGSALGPDWHRGIRVQGAARKGKRIHIEFKSEVKSVRTVAFSSDSDVFGDGSENGSWPVYVELSSGLKFGCDLVISAIGVTPNADLISPELLELGEDGAVKVDCNMRTNVNDVFAAGDVCHVDWTVSRQDCISISYLRLAYLSLALSVPHTDVTVHY